MRRRRGPVGTAGLRGPVGMAGEFAAGAWSAEVGVGGNSTDGSGISHDSFTSVLVSG